MNQKNKAERLQEFIDRNHKERKELLNVLNSNRTPELQRQYSELLAKQDKDFIYLMEELKQ